nr:thioesterase domain-containing protein [Nocardioides sp. MAH-18]
MTVAELRPGSDGTLFLLGGAGASTEELVPLVEGLPAGPRVVALALAADPGSADTVASMAAVAASAVGAEQPEGALRLLGYSFGGLLALEAAELLTAAGRSVAFVGLVDSFFDQRHWPTGLFARATARRTWVHLRDITGRPPVQALRELSARSARLTRRLRRRRGPAQPAVAALATPQDRNLAVMALWQPRVVDRPVTLFAATEADFGCDLAELWRPWLPQLEVRRVWGNHLDLTQTSVGAARLARAVSRAVEPTSGHLTVLVASTFRWPGAARLAADLTEVGCTVDGVAPRGSALHVVSAVRRSHPLGLVDPVGSLRSAIEASEPDLVIPFDDRTRQVLARIHAESDPTTASGSRMRELLEQSLGSPGTFASVYSRNGLMELARDAGVLCPPTAAVNSAADIAAWMGRNPGPAVLKTDGSWGGRGMAILRTDAEAGVAWRDLHRRPSLARALKRLVVERDPWALRAWVAGTRPTVSIQSYIEGRPANAAVACHRGTALGAVQAEVVESDGPTGPSTVLRVVDHPDMDYAVKSIVSRLELSGLCGLDFILDADGRAHLLELNPRATPTSHLIGADGADPLTLLRAVHGYDEPPARTASYPGGLVALFPQELVRDAGSRYLQCAHHDVPTYAPDLVAAALARPRGRRRGSTPRIAPAVVEAEVP